MSSPLILTPWEYWFLKKSLFEASLKFPKEPDDGDGFEYYQVMVDDFIKLDYKLFGDRNEDNPNKWNTKPAVVCGPGINGNFDIHLGCDYSMSEHGEGLDKYKLDTVMLL